MVNPITVYSTVWCGHCRRLKHRLDDAGVPYREVDLDVSPQRHVDERIVATTGGYRTVPAVEIGGELLINPTVDEVVAAIAADVGV